MLVCFFSSHIYLLKSSSRVDGELGLFQTGTEEVGLRRRRLSYHRVAKMMEHGIYAG